jgi:hypothetical protein
MGDFRTSPPIRRGNEACNRGQHADNSDVALALDLQSFGDPGTLLIILAGMGQDVRLWLGACIVPNDAHGNVITNINTGRCRVTAMG